MGWIKGIVLGALALFLLGCGGNVSINRAHVRFINLVPDGNTLDFYVQGTRAVADRAFPSSTAYANFDAGSTTFALTRRNESQVLASLTSTIQEPLAYSVVAIGFGDRDLLPSEFAVVILPDQTERPDQQTSLLRIANASPTAGPVDVYVTAPDADLATATPTYSNLLFGENGGYGTYTVGSERVRVTTVGTKTVLFDTNLFLSGRQVRTLFLRDPAGGGTPMQSSIVSDGD